MKYMGYYMYSSFTIKCDSLINPMWTKDGKDILQTGTEILLTQVTDKDGGTYTCSGKTKYGVELSEVTVLLIGGENVLFFSLYS